MKSRRTRCAIATAAPVTLILMGFTEPAWPQSGNPPAGGSGAALLVGGAVVVSLLLLTGFMVKLFDLKRQREAEAVHLQAQVADALLRDAALFRLSVTPTARLPLWRGSPALIELAGQVPSEDELQAVLRVVEDEARRTRPDVRIESRIGIVPTMVRRVA